ncbi:MAG: CDP-alcohol phosphatidyltransferase family protein [Clostridiales bacterium]|nr:CDP-alcohol phosphatidyltransferase family protein [Clostridiales bacterium]
MVKIKYIANCITIIRIAGAVVLLLMTPLSIPFFIVYFICCISDILDGNIARRTKTTSKLGEILDSIADFTLITVMLVIFIPLLEWKGWMLYWIGAIALVRFISLGVGFVKYRTIAFLHTYSNKITGIACACFPILLRLFGITATVFILCGMATLSGVEELLISVTSKKLDRNIINIISLFKYVL